MNRRLLSLLLMVLPCVLSAERSPGFSMSAFNAAVPSSARSAVFSPFAFELDCVVISEAFGPIEKSVYVEALGALVGYDSVYRPLIRRYAMSRTNSLELVSARAYLASSLQLISPKYRSYIQSEYGAHACSVSPTSDGAESFLKAAMDGAMEDFSVSAQAKKSKSVSFCDLESFRCRWSEPFPTANTRRVVFTGANGVRSELDMITDLRNVDIWTGERCSMLRLPMTDGAYFFVVLPDKGVPLDSIRGAFAADKFNEALVVFRAVGDPKVFRGSAAVVIPRMSLYSDVDLMPAFSAFSLPTGGFKDIFIGFKASLADLRQRVRFTLDERGPEDRFVVRKPIEEETHVDRNTRRFICDRPFLFFVYHEPTRTIPVAGIFAGGGK